jgi:hypothetical protein
MSGFTEQEKAFFRKQQGGGDSKLKVVGLVLVALLIGGIALDGLTGFDFIRSAKNPLIAVLGLLVLGVMYILGEIVSEWINKKDKKSNPLYLRAFHLMLLLSAAGVIVYFGMTLLALIGWEM